MMGMLRSAVTAVVVTFLTAAPGAAQISGLLKKARATLAGPTTATAAPTFDAIVLELDPIRLDAVITGRKAGLAQTGPAGASVADLHQQASAAFSRRDSLLEGRDVQLTTYQETSARIANCNRFFLDSLEAQRQQDMPQRIARLGGYQGQTSREIQALAMQMATKAAAGDTAGAFQLRDQINAKMGIDPKADSAKARAACGTEPAQPAWLAQAEAALDQGNQALAAARTLEQQGQAAAAKAAGLTGPQYAMALERIAAWLAAKGQPRLPWKFSATESAALTARRGDLATLGIE